MKQWGECCLTIRISAVREIDDPRETLAKSQPHRRSSPLPLDERNECPLGRLFLRGRINKAEYEAGCRWREIYHQWLSSIGAPNPFPAAVDWGAPRSVQDPLKSNFDDEKSEAIAKVFRVGEKALKKLGTRVFHSVNAIAVYEQPEELGEFEYTAKAAQIGLAALAQIF